jgi:hypothetical protein
MCRSAHRQEPVSHRATVAGHVSCLPLSSRTGTAARDRGAGPGTVGPQRQGTRRSRPRAAWRDESKLSRVLHDDVPGRWQHHPRARCGVHGCGVASVPLRCRQPAPGQLELRRPRAHPPGARRLP